MKQAIHYSLMNALWMLSGYFEHRNVPYATVKKCVCMYVLHFLNTTHVLYLKFLLALKVALH